MNSVSSTDTRRPAVRTARNSTLLLTSRRDLLMRSALGLGALGLVGVLGDCRELGAAENTAAGPMASKRPHFPGKARRVVHFFLNGGPSHVDTFDPKPALAKYDG